MMSAFEAAMVLAYRHAKKRGDAAAMAVDALVDEVAARPAIGEIFSPRPLRADHGGDMFSPWTREMG